MQLSPLRGVGRHKLNRAAAETGSILCILAGRYVFSPLTPLSGLSWLKTRLNRPELIQRQWLTLSLSLSLSSLCVAGKVSIN
jgi:hypothetical protein